MSREVPSSAQKNRVIPITDSLIPLPTVPIKSGTVIETNFSNSTGVPATEKLSQDSFLDFIDLYESDRDKTEAQKMLVQKEENGDNKFVYPPALIALHTIVPTAEWVTSTKLTKDKDGRTLKTSTKRKKRGKCLYCGKNTCWYCPTCSMKSAMRPNRPHRHWCCGPPARFRQGRAKDPHLSCQKAHDKEWKERLAMEENERSDDEDPVNKKPSKPDRHDS